MFCIYRRWWKVCFVVCMWKILLRDWCAWDCACDGEWSAIVGASNTLKGSEPHSVYWMVLSFPTSAPMLHPDPAPYFIPYRCTTERVTAPKQGISVPCPATVPGQWKKDGMWCMWKHTGGWWRFNMLWPCGEQSSPDTSIQNGGQGSNGQEVSRLNFRNSTLDQRFSGLQWKPVVHG